MNSGKNWLGLLGIGLGALALVIALGGWFAPMFVSGFGGQRAPQTYAQQGGRFQANEPQSGQFTPSTNSRSRDERQQGDMRCEGGIVGAGGLNLGRWFGFPFQLFSRLGDIALLALLALVGALLLRGRGRESDRPSQAVQKSAQERRSPTGESYVDESSDAV